MNNLELDVVAADSTENQNISTELRTHKSISMIYAKMFYDILKIKHNNNEYEMNKNEDIDFDRVVFLGLEEWKKEETGYEIIHVGKPADKRVLKKLGKVAFELEQLSSYPLIDGNLLNTILRKALGSVDKRTYSTYRKTVLYYSNVYEDIIENCVDSRLGTLNVSGFVRRIPYSFLKGSSP